MFPRARVGAVLLAVLMSCVILVGPFTAVMAAEDPPEFVNAWGSNGTGDGQFSRPWGIAIDDDDNLYVSDINNDRIQKFDSDGTYLDQWGSTGTGDGDFDAPYGVGIDSLGNIYVADSNNHRIQKFDSDGAYVDQWGTQGAADGQLWYPEGLTVDDNDNIYVVDYQNRRIQKFQSDGTYLAKWGSYGTGDGQFNNPVDVVVDLDGYVYVADSGNHRIQRFSSTGTFDSKWGTQGSGNGQFQSPEGLAVDTSGSILVADSQNHRIQKLQTDGTFLSKWGSAGQDEGQFSSPGGIAVDSDGDIYVVDTYNYRVQVFSYDTSVDVDITLKAGWNMVSVPVTADNMSTGEVFPGVDVVYTWNPTSKSYTMPTTVESEKAYWVAVTEDKTITVTGEPVEDWTDTIPAGWNMTGSVYGDSVAVADLVDNPSGCVQKGAIYHWNPTLKCYETATEIEQGLGYWTACTGLAELTVGPPLP